MHKIENNSASMTPRNAAASISAVRSFSHSSVPILLIRTHADIPELSAATTAARALSLSASATEDSRSRITESASDRSAGL